MHRKKLSHKSRTTWWSSLDGEFLFLEEQTLKLHIRPNFYLSCIQVTGDGWYQSDKSRSDTRVADYENEEEKHQGIQALERINLRATVVIPFRSSHEGSNSQARDDRAKPPHLPGPRWRLLFSPSFTCFLSPPSVFPLSSLRGLQLSGLSDGGQEEFLRSPDRMSWCHPCGDTEWGWTDGLERGSSAQQPW